MQDPNGFCCKLRPGENAVIGAGKDDRQGNNTQNTLQNIVLFPSKLLASFRSIDHRQHKTQCDYDAVEFDIPSGTQPGKEFVLRGKGIRSSLGNGNLFVKVSVEVPNSVSRSQKKALEEFVEHSDLKQCPKMKEYNEHLESLYGVKAYGKEKK
jgi:hypothetical protein